MIHLKNKLAEAIFIPERGGLMTSLKLPDSSDAIHELLWTPKINADETSWPGGGFPICFPFAGRVWNRGRIFHYGLNQNEYPMPLHGFAFAEAWSVKASSNHTLSLVAKQNSRTLSLYPFEFECECIFALSEEGISIHLQVKHEKALCGDLMPVALGFHPYFRADSTSTLDIDAKHYFSVTPEGGAGKPAPYNQQKLRLDDPLARSLIFADLQKQEIYLADKAKTICMSFQPSSVFKNIVIWQNKQDPFWCIEPWMSLPDAVNMKQGIHWLKANETLSCELNIKLK